MSEKYFDISEIVKAVRYAYELAENINSPIVESACVTCNQSFSTFLGEPIRVYVGLNNYTTCNGAKGLGEEDILMEPETLGSCRVSGDACKPDIEGNKWQECDSDHKVNGKPGVTMNSYMVCLKGGIISPFTDGQRIEELMGEKFPEYVTLEQLQQLGWYKPDAKLVFELNRTLEKYDITTTERIRHFLAQCMKESNKGMWLREGDNTGLNQKKLEEFYNNSTSYGYKYRGAGYIQITWDYNYLAFATYMIQQEYPELHVVWKSATNSSREDIQVNYDQVVENVRAAGKDIEKYERIVSEGADYVAEKYAWEAAGYFWFDNNINATIDILSPGKKEDVDEVSKIVNQLDEETFGERQDFYEETLAVIK